MPLEDLQRTHPAYRADLYEKYGDLYEGGERFDRHVDRYLIKRQIEESASKGGSLYPKSESGTVHGGAAQDPAAEAGAKQWEARKKRALYTPHVAGMIDQIVSAAHYEEPEIKSDDEYYRSLNKNVDGKGKDLAVLSKELLTDLLIYNRPFIAISVSNSATARNRQEAKTIGANDCRLSMLPTCMVNDWSEEAGSEYVRTYRCDLVRSKPWLPADTERHLWTYITADAVIEYELKCGEGKLAEYDTVPMVRSTPHDFGRLPVVPLKIHSGLWAMQRLAGIALARFNRRSSLTWSQDLMAFSLLVLSTNKSIQGLALTDFGALMLDQSDSAAFIAPPVEIVDRLFKDDEALRGDMYEVLNMMGFLASNQPENARQSAKAKNLDMQPLAYLLKSCAHAVRESFRQTLKAVQEFRGDSEESAQLIGMTDFDVQGLTARIDDMLKLNTLETFPEHAKAWNAYEVGLRICKQAPTELRSKLDDWLKVQLEKPVVKEEKELAPVTPSTVNNITVGSKKKVRFTHDDKGNVVGGEIEDDDAEGAD